MRFVQMLPAVFAASTLAAKFDGFYNVSCQGYLGDYKLVTLAEQEQIILKGWAGADTIPEASLAFSPPGSCPSNEDNTYKWITVPKWDGQTSSDDGAVAVVYFKKTDTYYNCGYLSATQQDGYQGNCN